MLHKESLGMCVLLEDVSGVGGFGSPPKYQTLSYPIHLLLFKQFVSTDYVSQCTKSSSLQSQRYEIEPFIVTPRGVFLHMLLDHSLTIYLHHHSPYLMPLFSSSHHLNPSPPPHCCLLCWVNKAEPSSAWLSWWLMTER